MNYENNPHYLNRYFKFIRSRTPVAGYVEAHHIYPRSMFPQLADDPNNIIRLTAREHFIAHWMLHKAFGGKMTQAFMYMKTGASQRYWNLNSKSYETLRAEFGRFWSERKLGKKLSEATRKAMSLGRTGKVLSESHRNAIGAGNKGRCVTDETRQRISLSKAWVTPNRKVSDSYRALMQRPKKKAACAKCGQLVAVNLIDRWHNDNCKKQSMFIPA